MKVYNCKKMIFELTEGLVRDRFQTNLATELAQKNFHRMNGNSDPQILFGQNFLVSLRTMTKILCFLWLPGR